MGGFAVQFLHSNGESKEFRPANADETWFVPGEHLDLLLRYQPDLEESLDLSEEEILSKSKANGLAKALVCIQALWFITQCVTRRIYKASRRA